MMKTKTEEQLKEELLKAELPPNNPLVVYDPKTSGVPLVPPTKPEVKVKPKTRLGWSWGDLWFTVKVVHVALAISLLWPSSYILPKKGVLDVVRDAAKIVAFTLAPSLTISTKFSPPTGHNHFFMNVSGSCSDSNDGLAATTGGGHGPWCTPNHALSCGDVIIAAAGAYPPLTSWGSVSSCPSSSGGINGAGGIYFAILLCGGSSVGDCSITGSPVNNSGALGGIDVNANNWAVEGFQVSEGYNASAQTVGYAFMLNTASTPRHHVAFINNIANHNATSFSINSMGLPVFGADYFAFLGNIAQDGAGRCDGFWDSAIDIIGIGDHDSTAGTHILVDSNFVLNSQQIGCGSGSTDGEAIMLDTLTANGVGYTQSIVLRNNITVLTERFGIHFFYDGTTVSAKVKAYNNTVFASSAGAHSNDGAGGSYGDLNINTTNMSNSTIALYNNIAKTNIASRPDGGIPYALVSGATGTASRTTIGNTGTNPSGSQNIISGLATVCNNPGNCDSGSSPFNAVAFNGESLGVNTYTNPSFTDSADVLTNRIGTPNCSGFETTTACMGWNYTSQSVTNPSLIRGMTPTAGGTTGKGYQPPGLGCLQPSSDPDFPSWLAGIVYLVWDGVNVKQKAGLMAVPCGM